MGDVSKTEGSDVCDAVRMAGMLVGVGAVTRQGVQIDVQRIL